MTDYSHSRHSHPDTVTCAAAGDAGHPAWADAEGFAPPHHHCPHCGADLECSQHGAVEGLLAEHEG